MKSLRKKKRTIRKSIPWELHMAIVRLQGAEELEYDEACLRAAALIQDGGEKYDKAVKIEASRMYKSRFLGEQNKARHTWYQNGYNKGFEDGRRNGYYKGVEENQIKYPCSRCGGDMFLRPDNEDTKAAIEFLKSKGWGHSGCHRK